MRIAASTAIRGMAATALALLTMASATGAAQASPAPTAATALAANCPGDGKVGPGAACTTLSSGELFHYKFSNGPRFEVVSYYQKTSGSKIVGKLGYSYKNKTTWGSSFTQTSGTRKTSTWHPSGISQCSPTVGLLSVQGQRIFQTPLANC